MTRLWPVLAGALAVLLLVSHCSGRRALAERDARVDSLRTDLLVAGVDSAGWEVRLVGATEGLEAQLQELGDSTALLATEKAALALEVESLGGQLRVVADMYASLAGSIEAHDATVHTSARDGESTVDVPYPDSVTAPIDDGLLSGRLAFFPPSALDLQYRVELALALGWIEAADGRALVTARAEHPNVTLRYGEVFYQPPSPVEFCSFGTKATWAGIGGGVAELVRLITSLVNPKGG
jgi:hypothetical protein